MCIVVIVKHVIFSFALACGHTMMKTPVLVSSLQLSIIGQFQYLEG